MEIDGILPLTAIQYLYPLSMNCSVLSMNQYRWRYLMFLAVAGLASVAAHCLQLFLLLTSTH